MNAGIRKLEERKRQRAENEKAKKTPIKGPAYMPFMAALGRKVSPPLTPGRHIARLDSIDLTTNKKTSKLFGMMTWVTHEGTAGTIQINFPEEPKYEDICKKNCGFFNTVLEAVGMSEIAHPNWKQVGNLLKNTLFSIELKPNKGYLNLEDLEVLGVLPDPADADDNQTSPDGDTTGEDAEEHDHD